MKKYYSAEITNIGKNKSLEKFLFDSKKELDAFWGIAVDLPIIILLNSRKEIDRLWGRKTERWIVAWAKNETIFILKPEKLKSESDNHNISHFGKLIKHEYNHLYFRNITGNNTPKWLNEGLSCFVADQKKPNPLLEELLKVSYYFDHGDSGVYSVGYFLVNYLIKHFGFIKMKKLIRSLKNISTANDFSKNFEKIYKISFNKKNLKQFLENS